MWMMIMKGWITGKRDVSKGGILKPLVEQLKGWAAELQSYGDAK